MGWTAKVTMCVALIAALLMAAGNARADGEMQLSASVSGASGSGSAFVSGDTHTLTLAVQGGTGETMDVYVALQMPDSTFLGLTGVNAFGSIAPLASLPLTELSDISVASLPLSGIPEGTYIWYFVAAPTGADVTDATNWSASATATWTYQDEVSSPAAPKAVVTTIDAGYTSGAVSAINSDMTASNNLLAFTTSDNMVATYGDYAYVLSRYGTNAVTKLPLSDMDESAVVYQYSAKDDNDSSDPNLYDMVFLSETKAYLIRNGSSLIWVVNPSATSETEWKTGSIDLSSLLMESDGDGSPEPAGGVIVDGKLYVVCQNLDMLSSYSPLGASTVVVIDTATDTLVDTDGDDTNGTTPITCAFGNAHGIEYVGGALWVSQTGDAYGSSGMHSGLERIVPDTYVVNTVFDGGSMAEATYGGAINDVAMVSATQGFCNIYVAWGDVRIRSFTVDGNGVGTVGEEVSALSGVTNNNGIEAGPDGKLWILSVVGDGGVVVYDPATQAAADAVNVGLLPYGIAFVE